MAFVEQDIEELPAIHTIRGFCPDVRAIYTTIHFQAYFLQSFPYDSGILEVVLDQCAALVVSFPFQGGKPTSLSNIACSIEEGTLSAIPHGVQETGGSILTLQFLWNNRPTQANT